MNTRLYLEDFDKIEQRDVEKGAGGRRAFRRAQSVLVHLPDGRNCEVQLGWFNASIKGGQHREMRCPTCGLRIRTLMVVPGEQPLMCRHCVRRRFGAIYRCQQKNQNGHHDRKEKT